MLRRGRGEMSPGPTLNVQKPVIVSCDKWMGLEGKLFAQVGCCKIRTFQVERNSVITQIDQID